MAPDRSSDSSVAEPGADDGGLDAWSNIRIADASSQSCDAEAHCDPPEAQVIRPAAEAGVLADGTNSSVDANAEVGLTDAISEVAVSCVPNACGGCAALDASPGRACGQCGAYVCDPEGSISCQDPSHPMIKSIGGGFSHTCAVTMSGGVRCWGGNSNGQLGDGSTNDRSTPGPVDILTGVAAIAVGGLHTCALMRDAGVKCWGNNDYGQLGDGTTAQHSTPVDVLSAGAPLTGVQAITAGYQHTCALGTDGLLRCWGLNDKGQLGDGTLNSRSLPGLISALSTVQAVSAGLYHTCALIPTGVLCWGTNDGGQLGDGSTISRPTPVRVMTSTGALDGVRTISAGGYHTCAIMAATQGIRCWGYNLYGEVGDGTTASSSVAPSQDFGTGFRQIAGGNYFTCGLTDVGGVRCWGLNANGELGDGTTNNRLAVLANDTIVGVQSITSGNDHACAATATTIQCWGFNSHSQLGDGTTVNHLNPAPTNAICP